MKKSLFALLSLLAATNPGLAQSPAAAPIADALALPVAPTPPRITYAAVQLQPEATQAELYARGALWFATPAYAGRLTLRAADPQAGVLQGTGARQLRLLLQGTYYFPTLLFTVRLAVKEGRYRYELTDFRFRDAPVLAAVAPPEPLAAEVYLQPSPHRRKASQQLTHAARQALTEASTELVASLQADLAKPTTGPAGW